MLKKLIMLFRGYKKVTFYGQSKYFHKSRLIKCPNCKKLLIKEACWENSNHGGCKCYSCGFQNPEFHMQCLISTVH